jgi:hypothetical protein
MTMKSAIYRGTVTHRRLNPVGHHLDYRIFYLLIDLDELGVFSKEIPFFSINKRNIVSLFSKDFGSGTTANLKGRIFRQLQDHGLSKDVSSIRLLAIPRLFGYAFNPLSTFYCFDEEENLVALIYEVSNTFGEKHSYVLPAGPANAKGLMKQACSKEFYVSPFMPMECRYEFSILPPGEKIALSIRQLHEGKPIMNASFTGERRALNRHNLGRALMAFPFNSVKVIAGIHWEALKLWMKGLKLVPRPKKPLERDITSHAPLIEQIQEK